MQYYHKLNVIPAYNMILTILIYWKTSTFKLSIRWFSMKPLLMALQTDVEIDLKAHENLQQEYVC